MTTVQNNINTTPTTTRYLLAGPWIRLFARVLDFVFISIISFLLGLFVFINSEFTIADLFKDFSNGVPPYFDPWRLFLMITIVCICTFFYFCIIPYLTKGFTLFKYAFKIRLWTKMEHKNFFWLIFKHEFLIWFFMIFFLFLFGIFVLCAPDAYIENKRWSPAIMLSKFLFSFSRIDFNNNTPQWVKVYFGLATFTKTMLACSGMIPAILFFYMFFHKNKMAAQDIVSETFVYYINQYIEKEPVSENQELPEKIDNKNNNSLPGINDNIKVKSEVEKLKTPDNNQSFDQLLDRHKEVDKLKD